MTVRAAVLQSVQTYKARPFLVDAIASREFSYGEFHRLACSLAVELGKRGVQPGDRVAMMLPNCCELAVLYFACLYAGATSVPINPNLSQGDLNFILSSSRPRLLVAGRAVVERLAGLHPNLVALMVANEAGGSASENAIDIGSLPSASDAKSLLHLSDDALIVLMYTSGTTAKPKGLAHRTARMFRNAQAFASVQGIDRESRFYLTLSMAYMGGFYNLLILPFLHGASVVVDQVFDARSSLNFWDRVSRSGANTLWLAPTVMSVLLKMDRGRTGEQYCRESIRHTFVGFAPLALKVKEDFERRYGVRLIENYGLSETLFLTARSRSDYSQPGYVGEALPGIELRVLDDDGSPLPAGADGEIQLLTPDLMAGYLEPDGVLREVDASQWFATGDFGRVDEHGALCITGRKKDIIIRGGVNISPAAIEEVLLRCAGVADAAIVSMPHELYGEDIVAVLKLESGLELEGILNDVMAYCKANLAAHQQPARYLAMSEFPKTASGKVQKSVLRALVKEKFQAASRPVVQAGA